jgi:uncharacterized protein YecE (DUF72 family)
VRIGCANLPAGVARDRYFKRLEFLAVEDTLFDLPRAAVLQRWRREAPPAARFALVAWQLVTHPPGRRGYPRLKQAIPDADLGQLGSLRDTPEVNAALRRTLEAADLLAAEAVVFRTPPSFTPSTTNRDTLRRFFRDVCPRTPGRALVWEPEGLWEPSAALALAGELDVVLATDPLAIDPTAPDRGPAVPDAGGQAYLRVSGLGRARPRLRDDELDELAALVEPLARVWVVFAHEEKQRDALRFARLLRETPPAAVDEDDMDEDDEDADPDPASDQDDDVRGDDESEE